MMNERIKELAEQARFMAEETINRKISKNAVLDAFAEKFAELIVREHLSVWEAMDNGNAVEGYVDMEDYPLAIRKRFGIGK